MRADAFLNGSSRWSGGERGKRKKDRSRTKSKDEPKFQVSAAMIGKRGSLISRADSDHELSARREGVRKRVRK